MNKNIYLSLLILTAAFKLFANGCDTADNCASTCDTKCSQSKNYLTARAFSSYSSRNLILEKPVFQTCSDREEWNGTLSVAAEYMSNFGQKCNSCQNIGALPFWSGTNTMTVGNNDGKADVDAFQFGLGNVSVDSDGIGGTIQLSPQISQIGADFLLYFTQYKDKRGFYFKIDAPLGAMRINTRFAEPVQAKPVDGFTFTQVTAAPNSSTITITDVDYPIPANRPQTMTEAFQGFPEQDEIAGYEMPTLTLLKGRIAPACCTQTAIRLADLSAVVGYNLYANEKSLIGVGFKATMPTGNVPTGNFMLEPVFGRGGAWGVGGEVMAHHKAWENEAGTRYLDLWLQGEALHLVPGRSGFRSFDLKANGLGSKYLLVQRYSDSLNTTTNPFTDNGFLGGSVTQAINLTTLPVISKIAVEGSVALMVDFHCNNWNLGVGGEFWGRSGECLSIDECSPFVAAFKGDLNHHAVVGRQLTSYTIEGQGELVTNYCEPLAKINESQAPVTLVGSVSTVTAPTTLPTGIALASDSANRIPAAYEDALDIAGAAASKVFTGKVFGQVGYTFAEHRYSPTLSVVGGAEFTNGNNNAVQLWSVALQGSLNF